jgi:hypothetical protein
MTKGKKNSAAMQALLDMQNDGTTVKITVGEDDRKTNWVNTGPDDNYLAYLVGDIENTSDGLDEISDYDDIEVGDMFLD